VTSISRDRASSRDPLFGLGSNHVEITDRHPTDGRWLQWVDTGPELATVQSKLIMIVNFDQVIRRIMGEGR
jgi:hypothetical protein